MALSPQEEEQVLELIRGITANVETLESAVEKLRESNPGLDISTAKKEINRFLRNANDRADMLGVDKKTIEGSQVPDRGILTDRTRIEATHKALADQSAAFGAFKNEIITGLTAKINALNKQKEEAAAKEKTLTPDDFTKIMHERLAADNKRAGEIAASISSKPPEQPKAPVSAADISAAVASGFSKAGTIKSASKSIFAKPAVEEKQPGTIEEAKKMTEALIKELKTQGIHVSKLPLYTAKSIEEVLEYKKELQGKLDVYKETSQAPGNKQRRT